MQNTLTTNNMAYNQPQDSNKDKRISFLSLYSTLAPLTENAETKAFELNERLYEKYPISMQGGGNHQVSYNNRTTPPKNAPQSDKPTTCPQCGNQSLYHNIGISKKNNKPFENYKCNKCQHIEWVDRKLEEHMAEDNMQDEAKHQNEHMDNYGKI